MTSVVYSGTIIVIAESFGNVATETKHLIVDAGAKAGKKLHQRPKSQSHDCTKKYSLCLSV